MSHRHQSTDSLVRITDLVKEYGDTRAVDGVSLSINVGEIFGLLGPNGAGKSTIIKILTTITQPTAGRAVVDGCPVTEEPHQVRRRIDYVPQRVALDYWLTARQTLRLFGAFRNIPRSDLDQRVEFALNIVGLREHGDDRVDNFSGGMKRRLEIASGLLHRPELVILDEPTLGLDPGVRTEIWDYIEEIRAEGTSILLATHYLDEADTLCDRLTILDDGRVAATGTPQELTAAGESQQTLQEVFHAKTSRSAAATREVAR